MFLSSITQYTREMCDELTSMSYQHIHFFTFDYDCTTYFAKFVHCYNGNNEMLKTTTNC